MSWAIYKSSALHCRHSNLLTLSVIVLLMRSLCFFAQLGIRSPLPKSPGRGRYFGLDVSEYVSDDGEAQPNLSS